jgi:hypothetical protein
MVFQRQCCPNTHPLPSCPDIEGCRVGLKLLCPLGTIGIYLEKIGVSSLNDDKALASDVHMLAIFDSAVPEFVPLCGLAASAFLTGDMYDR